VKFDSARGRVFVRTTTPSMLGPGRRLVKNFVYGHCFIVKTLSLPPSLSLSLSLSWPVRTAAALRDSVLCLPTDGNHCLSINFLPPTHPPPRGAPCSAPQGQAESGGMVLVAYAGLVCSAAALHDSVLYLPTDIHSLLVHKPSSSPLSLSLSLSFSRSTRLVHERTVPLFCRVTHQVSPRTVANPCDGAWPRWPVR